MVFIALMAALVTACWALTQLSSATGQWLTILCVGTSGGLFSMLLVVIWPRFFGRKHLGKISSINMMTMTGASALGPWLFARSVELTGSYETAFQGCGLAALVLLAATFSLENPSATKAL
jgi:cyanate permease